MHMGLVELSDEQGARREPALKKGARRVAPGGRDPPYEVKLGGSLYLPLDGRRE